MMGNKAKEMKVRTLLAAQHNLELDIGRYVNERLSEFTKETEAEIESISISLINQTSMGSIPNVLVTEVKTDLNMDMYEHV